MAPGTNKNRTIGIHLTFLARCTNRFADRRQQHHGRPSQDGSMKVQCSAVQCRSLESVVDCCLCGALHGSEYSSLLGVHPHLFDCFALSLGQWNGQASFCFRTTVLQLLTVHQLFFSPLAMVASGRVHNYSMVRAIKPEHDGVWCVWGWLPHSTRWQ
jgi:hypothetical protein